jgi:hypothetical protein
MLYVTVATRCKKLTTEILYYTYRSLYTIVEQYPLTICAQMRNNNTLQFISSFFVECFEGSSCV